LLLLQCSWRPFRISAARTSSVPVRPEGTHLVRSLGQENVNRPGELPGRFMSHPADQEI
jgi:hypothetical protein